MAKQNTKENNSIKNKQDDGNCGCSIAIVFAAFFSNVIGEFFCCYFVSLYKNDM